MDTPAGVLMVVGAVLIAAVLVMAMKRRRPDSAFDIIRQADRHAQSLSGTQRPTASPVDLARPFGDAEWKAIHSLRRDARYRGAVEAVRARYSIVANPMLLPNTLRETMARQKVDLAEALLILSRGEDESRAH